MTSIRVLLYRSEKTGTIPAQADEQLYSLRYNMSRSGTARLTPGANTEDLVSSYPIAIYSYSVQIMGDFYGVLYQTFGDNDDLLDLTNFSLTNDKFNLGLKQHKIIAGTSTALSRANITYRAKKNPKHMRARFGKWKRPPIFLGPDSGDLFNISVYNASDSVDRSCFAIVSIHSWKQFT